MSNIGYQIGDTVIEVPAWLTVRDTNGNIVDYIYCGSGYIVAGW